MRSKRSRAYYILKYFNRKIEESNIRAAQEFLNNFQNENSKLCYMISEFQKQANFFNEEKSELGNVPISIFHISRRPQFLYFA